MYQSTFIFLLLLICLSCDFIKDSNIQAHNFDTDDNSTFLTLVNQIMIENRLIDDSIRDTSITTQSIDNIEKLTKDIAFIEYSLLIDTEQFYNKTILAQVVANLADEVLRIYAEAFGITSNKMLNMDFTDVVNSENNNSNTTNNYSFEKENEGSHSILLLKDTSSLYKALETSNRIMEIYDRDLDDAIVESSSIIPLSNLKAAIYELNEAIKQVSAPFQVMEIVHGKLHPNLQLAFNLELKR